MPSRSIDPSGIRSLLNHEYRASDDDADLEFGVFAPNALQALMIAAARNSFLRRGLFRKTVTQLILGVTGTPIDVHFRAAAYRLRGSNNLIEYGLLLNPAYNVVDIEFLLEGAEEGATCVDIGANIGLYSLPLAKKVGPAGTVIAVDANPLMADRLRWNAGASDLENVAVFNCALSDAPGRARLNIRKNDVGIVSITEDPDGDLPVRTLASILDEAGVTAISGLKIDIEGHEDKVLAPFLARASDDRIPKRIVIEKMGSDADYPACAAQFARRGYQLVGRTNVNSLYAR